MITKTNSVFFLALFFAMLTTGVFWGTWFTLTRSLETFSIEEFIHIGKVIIANVANPMKAILPSCLVLMIASICLYPSKKTSGFYFVIVAFALMLITLLITLLVLVPIDNEIKTWTAITAPQNWETLRDKWKLFHFARTLTSLSSFGCLAGGVLFRK